MIKKIIILILIVIVGFLLMRLKPEAPVTSTVSQPTVVTSTSTPVNKPIPTNKDKEIKDSAWKVFEAYTKAAETKNLDEVKRLSYQISDVCLDQSKIKECEERMSTAANFAKQFKYDEMKYTAYDDKQIILSGDYYESLEGGSPSFTRGALYFVREGANIKFLSLNPFLGAIVVREENEATTTVRDRLLDATEDSDLDYIYDVFEKCVGMSTLPDCVKTDTNKRDTNGDGYWDSIEALFYNKTTQ